MKLYKSYMFRTKDPVIDELNTLISDKFGPINHKTLSDIERNGGPSVSCMSAWFFGATQRPTNPTIEAAGRAIGFKRVWRKM
jgi:hypothetical protein